MQRIQAGRKQGELALYLDSPMMGDALNVTTGESWREKNFKSEMCRKVRGSATKRMECLLIPPPSVKSFCTAVLVCREHHCPGNVPWISMALTRHARPIIDMRPLEQPSF